MGVRALRIDWVDKYVLPSDPDYRVDGQHAPGATIWHLRALSGVELADIKDRQSEVEVLQFENPEEDRNKIRVMVYKVSYQTLARALANVENFCGPDGKPIPFKPADPPYRGAHADFLRHVDPSTAFALHRRVMELNSITEDEEKNSDAS